MKAGSWGLRGRRVFVLCLLCLILFSIGCIDSRQLMDFLEKRESNETQTTVTTSSSTTSSSTSVSMGTSTSSSSSTTAPSASTTSSSTTTSTLFWDVSCERQWGQKARDECYRDLAVERKDSSICGRLELKSFRDACYYRMALATRNASLCNNLFDSIIRERCYRFLVG